MWQGLIDGVFGFKRLALSPVGASQLDCGPTDCRGCFVAQRQNSRQRATRSLSVPLKQVLNRKAGDDRWTAEVGPMINRVLIIDDDSEDAEISYKALVGAGYNCCVITDNQEVERMVDLFKPDLILTDYRMAGRSGPDVARDLRRRKYKGFIVALSGLEPDLSSKIFETFPQFDARLTKNLSITEFNKICSQLDGHSRA